MAEIEEYISSGILELYVYGALSETESREVTDMLREYPEVEKEVEEIEDALQKLAVGVAPYNPEALLASLKSKLTPRTPVRSITPEMGGLYWLGSKFGASYRIVLFVPAKQCT